jgi:sulfide dehydrogenase cytochrome subunit
MRTQGCKGFLAVGLLVLASFAWALPPDPAMLANACGGCHGTRGHSAGLAIPSLAGQPKDYFIVAMKRFRSDERPSTIMGRLAKGYSDAEIEAMAGYFARQKPLPQDGPLDAVLVKKGMKIYDKECKYCHLDGRLWAQFHEYREYDKDCNRSCHLDYGSDTNDEVPTIAGQWPKYLEIQMEDFRNGSRKMSKRKAEHLKALSREDMEAVAQFYAAQKDPKR